MIETTGFVNILKPTGMTSSDVVCSVKKILKTKKVGHLGTLDPAASGVLPIAIGKATKFFDYFLKKDKEYFAIVEFGIETDTPIVYNASGFLMHIPVSEKRFQASP